MKKENAKFDRINEWEESDWDAMILEAFEEDNTISIPDDFADRLEQKAIQINTYRYWTDELIKQLILIGGVIVMLAVVYGVLYYFKAQNIEVISGFILRYKGLLFVGILLVLAIQLGDSWVARKLGMKPKG